MKHEIGRRQTHGGHRFPVKPDNIGCLLFVVRCAQSYIACVANRAVLSVVVELQCTQMWVVTLVRPGRRSRQFSISVIFTPQHVVPHIRSSKGVGGVRLAGQVGERCS